jgi:hypothetical protein
MSSTALKLAVAGELALLLLLTTGATWKVQDWRYGKQLAEQSGAYQDDLTAISNAAADQVRTALEKRLALEQRFAASDQTHHEALTNEQKNRLAYAIALPLLICGCQSSSPRIQPVAVQCQPVPAPSAWFMEERAPDLPQRMLNELSESPEAVIKD